MADKKTALSEARQKQIDEAKEAREARQSKIAELRALIGKEFSNDKVKGTIVDFTPDKLLGMKVSDAFLINLGNPHRHDYIFCDDFSNKYTIKTKD